MSANLRRLAFSQGSKKKLDIEQKLMERMRDVTVSMLHTAVHTVALYEARQSPGESTKGFAARVHGTKSNYNLVKLLVLQDSFFLDETGLLDSDTQERDLSAAILKTIMDTCHPCLVHWCALQYSSHFNLLF